MSYTLFDWGVYNEKGEELVGGLKSYAMAFDVASRIAVCDRDFSVTYRTFLFGQLVTVTLKKDAKKIVIGQMHDFGGGPAFYHKYTFHRTTLQRAYLERNK